MMYTMQELFPIFLNVKMAILSKKNPLIFLEGEIKQYVNYVRKRVAF